jgi:hypothetical protein
MPDSTPPHGSEVGRDASTASSASVPTVQRDRAGAGTLWLFTATTFLSALLLFAIQPMFAKMVLPVLGGSPSVWAVAMLFFQAALLAGYCYAHVLLRFVPPKVTGFIHLAVCAVAFLVLPIGLPAWFGEPPAGEPYLWQLGLFSVAVGLPFFAVAANAPLLQAWFASTGHRQSGDPYFLYAASNFGSFLALLGYPLVLEPLLGLRALSWYWTFGFCLLAAALATSFWVVRRFDLSAPGAPHADSAEADSVSPSWTQRSAWIGLALVPSALLTAFTNHVSTDVASAPLIWVLPLALYLLTFVLVFRREPRLLTALALIIGVAVAVAVSFVSSRFLADWETWTSVTETVGSTRIVIGAGIGAAGLFLVWQNVAAIDRMGWMRGVHLAAVVIGLLALSQTRYDSWFISATLGVIVFFSATMVAHRTLYEARPAPAHLTEFYLWMSLGGALGGLFAALIAPKIFSEVYEYPILVALTMACRPRALAGFIEGGRALAQKITGRPGAAPASATEPAVSDAATEATADDRDRIDELMVLWLIAASGALAWLLMDGVLRWLRMLDLDSLPTAIWWLKWPLSLVRPIGLWGAEWGVAAIIAALFALVLLAAWRRPTRQLVAALAMCGAVVTLESSVHRSAADRSYFGVYRVYQTGNYNVLMHGTTLHGAQRIRDEAGNLVVDTSPTTYYYPASPMARSVEFAREHISRKGGTARFGVIGLGSGSLSCHAAEGEKWRFFEIDPVMVQIATDPANFSYLARCQPNPPDIVVGDARLTMAREPHNSFDLLIVDAFSSDAVPIHLMTVEALKLYLDKISPNGIVVLHVSNRYLDLDGVLAATLRLVPGAHGIVVSDDAAEGGYAATTSTVVVVSKNAGSLEPFRELADVTELDDRSGRARNVNCSNDLEIGARAGCLALQVLRHTGLFPSTTGLRPWTDDFSDILGPFLTKMRLDE